MAPPDPSRPRHYPRRPDGLPGNDGTERALLGCLLLAPERLSEVRGILRPADFRAPRHAALYALILDLDRRGKVPTALIVGDEIEARGDAPTFGGLAYVDGLPTVAGTVEQAEDLARAVRNHGDRRALIEEARRIEEEARDPGADLSGRMVALGIPTPDDRRLLDGRAGAFLDRELARFRDRAEGREAPIPVPWPRTRELLCGGLWPGAYVLVGGTGAGKSQWAFEVMYWAGVIKGHPVAYAGLELDRAGMIARLAALGFRRGLDGTGRPLPGPRPAWRDLYLGEHAALRALDGGTGRAVLDAIGRAPVYLETGEARGGWPYTRIGDLAAELRRAHPTGPALLVVDFLQLVGASPLAPREDIRERIAGAAYLARMAARKHTLSVLLLSSVARAHYPTFAGGNENNAGGPLGAGDLARFLGTGKESGETEYAADGVLALGRQREEEGPGASWLAVAKARTGLPSGLPGPVGWSAYRFEEGTTFEEIDPVGAAPVKRSKPPGGEGSTGKPNRSTGKGRDDERGTDDDH